MYSHIKNLQNRNNGEKIPFLFIGNKQDGGF